MRLRHYLEQQRWFGGKSRTVTGVSPGTDVTLPGEGLERFHLSLAEVRYAEAAPEHYLLTLSGLDDGPVVDALRDDAFARALLELIRGERHLPLPGMPLRGELLFEGREDVSELPLEPDVRRLGGEQSNTSLVFADRAILKLLRRVEPGLHPEYELGRLLAAERFPWAPPLLGALQLEGPGGTTLAVLHRFLPDAEDGWQFLVQALRDGREHHPVLRADVERLGRRLAQLHLALAQPHTPAFQPEPLLPSDLQGLSASIIGEFGVTLALGAQRLQLPVGFEQHQVERLAQLAHLPAGGCAQRIHGDLHLGQVLARRGDWYFFDFEGEPARPLARRRERHSPLRDVAGLTRSLAYADAVAPGGEPGHPRVRLLRDALLQGYRDAMSGSGLVPDGPAFDVLLDSLEFEKLLYELRYELQHRPSWAHIPAADLLAPEPLPP